MANEYFNHGSYPAQGASGSSSAMRAELDAIDNGFDKLPALSGNGALPVFVNSGGTGLEAANAATARARLGVDLLEVATHAATGKTTPVDADEIPLADSAAAYGLKKLTWANLKATLASVFQAASANLDEYAAVNPTAAGLALLDDATAGDQRTTLGLAIGTDVQAYDVDTAKLDVDQTWTGAQRGTVTADNDGSFDQAATNNFACTPTGNVTLTFTNHTAGQSGFILFDNTGAYTGHSLAATTKASSTFLTTINASGVYLIAYFDNGTNAYVTTTSALA